RLVELAARNRGIHRGGAGVDLCLWVVELVCKVEATTTPGERVAVLAADKCDRGAHVVTQRAKNRIPQAIGDPTRLCGILRRLVVVRIAASDERLRASRAFRFGTFERVLDPAADEVARRRSSPHPCACHRLEGELRVEIGGRRVAAGERDRPPHRRGETRTVEIEGTRPRDLSPDLELSL